MFEWDPAKNAANRRKHGIGFEEAAEIFDGPALSRVDDNIHKETRERSYGLVRDVVCSVPGARGTGWRKTGHQRAESDQEGTRGISCPSHKGDWLKSRRWPTRTSTPPRSRKPTKHGSGARSWSSRRETEARRHPPTTGRRDARLGPRSLQRRGHDRCAESNLARRERRRALHPQHQPRSRSHDDQRPGWPSQQPISARRHRIIVLI